MGSLHKILSCDDSALEREIREARQRMQAATRSEVRRIHMDSMAALIALRSPQMVEFMEQQKGLL